MPSRLASDRPIKNVIGSVNQTLLQRGGGLAGGRVAAAAEASRVTGQHGVVQGKRDGKRARGEWRRCEGLYHTL